MSSHITISEIKEYDINLIQRTVSDILDQSGLVFSGKTVLVKPNLLGPWGPDSGVVTHPSIVKAVKDGLLTRGAKVFVGDNPGVRGYGKMIKTAEISGTLEAAGDCFINMGRRPYKHRTDSKYTDCFSISTEVLEADYFISLPKFKTHMSTVLTGAIKNSFGLLVGAEKMRLHGAAPKHAAFGELIVDIYSIRPPDLVILDAVVGMEGNGPSAGNPRKIGHLLSSDSGGAIDLAMCHMAGINPSRVPPVTAAIDRKLAPSRIEDIDITGILPLIENFKAPRNLVRFDPGGIVQKLVSSRMSTPRLSADESKCTKCGTCAKSCPVNAIDMYGGYPSFDRSKCIACYCCHELCPESAVKTGRLTGILRG
ncbi:MAG: DUF362 domain-containing protein [Actinobacteria bacterium]|nr:DUF362 domain-containing protein [Actinomycetota bacterium]